MGRKQLQAVLHLSIILIFLSGVMNIQGMPNAKSGKLIKQRKKYNAEQKDLEKSRET